MHRIKENVDSRNIKSRFHCINKELQVTNKAMAHAQYALELQLPEYMFVWLRWT
jgi:hypothetical protein